MSHLTVADINLASTWSRSKYDKIVTDFFRRAPIKNMEVCNNPEPKTVWVKDEPEAGKMCDKFQAKVMHRCNNSLLGSEMKSRELAKEQSKVQDIIAKILDKNSPKTSNMDKKVLMKSLKSIPLVKRKDFIMQITKNLLMKYPGSNGE